MVTFTRKFLNSLTAVCCSCLLVCAIICSNIYGAPTDKAAYQEIRKDGRIYVFNSLTRKEDFEKSGEVGKSIIKIGYGPNGETVIFDSDEAVQEYEKRNIR